MNSPKVNEDTVKIKKLEKEVDMYEKEQHEVKMIAKLSLLANEAALSDARSGLDAV